MKKALVVLATAALLVMGVSAAWASPIGPSGSITINDLEETGLGVTPTNGTYVTFNTPTLINNETASITGTWDATGSGIILFRALHAVFMQTPNPLDTSDTGDNGLWPSTTSPSVRHISDFITFTASSVGASTPGLQNFTIYFESDGLSTFQTDLLAKVPNGTSYKTIIENGTYQDMSLALLGSSNAFTISAASDTVPLPGALLLLGGGLLRLAGYSRRKRQVAA